MYINSQNQLYFGDCAQGDREATAEEIAAWEFSRLPTTQDKLNALDSANALTQRNLREFILLTAQAIKATNPALDLTQIPGVAKVAMVEAEAAQLRAAL